MNRELTVNKNECPVCTSKDIEVFVEIPQVPVHCNILWSTRNEALNATRGDIRLGFCKGCEHTFNLVFDPGNTNYTEDYENSLHFSPHFHEYAKSLATRLIDQHDLHNKDIIEIGCGKGDFLKLICKLGENRGVGFDKSYVPEQSGGMAKGQFTFIQDFYSERYANYKADLICCQHVLEHIHSPHDFLINLRYTIGDRPDTKIFFEVPNMLFIVRDLSIWDIIYEHNSYFSKFSLSRLFWECGFKVCDLYEAYDGQFICIEALPDDSPVKSEPDQGMKEFEGMNRYVADFAKRYHSKIKDCQEKLKSHLDAGRRIVIWGAGSKGVTFLNTLKLFDQIEYIVDVNPRKKGKYIAGTGQQIVLPDFLQKNQPDVVIIMNSIYKNEIIQRIKKLGLAPEIMCM